MKTFLMKLNLFAMLICLTSTTSVLAGGGFDFKSIAGSYRIVKAEGNEFPTDRLYSFIFEANPRRFSYRGKPMVASLRFGQQYERITLEGSVTDTTDMASFLQDANGVVYHPSATEPVILAEVSGNSIQYSYYSRDPEGDRYEFKFVNASQVEVTHKRKRCLIEHHGCYVPGIGWSKSKLVLQKL